MITGNKLEGRAIGYTAAPWHVPPTQDVAIHNGRQVVGRLAIVVAFVAAAIRLSAFETGTMAFYGFTEGASGASVSGVTNSVNHARYPGSVRIVNGGTSDDLVYDDDVPAKYLFEGVPTDGSVPVCTSWKSINAPRVGPDVIGEAIDFEGLATALSSNETFTIEFFYKIPTSEAGIGRNQSMLTFDMQSEVVYMVNGTSYGSRAMWFSLLYPDSGGYALPRIGTSWGFTNAYRTFKYAAFPPYLADLADGEWHHIAIVCEGFGAQYTLWCDYYSENSQPYAYGSGPLTMSSYRATHKPQTVSRPLSLFNGVHRGKIAGLRVSRTALGLDSFLRAFDFASTATVFHWRLDGRPGDVLPEVLTNDAPSFASSLTNQFYRLATQGSSLAKLTGNGRVVKAEGQVGPACTNATWKYRVGVGKVPLVPGDNLSSVAMTPKDASNDSYGLRTGSSDGSDKMNFTLGTDSFTIECFARFDYDSWWNRIGSVDGIERYLTLVGYKGETGGIFGRLYYVVNKFGTMLGMNMTLLLTSGAVKSWAISGVDFTKWHHFAWVYDEPTKTFKVYVDYDEEPKLSVDLSETPPKVPANNFFFVGTPSGAPTFEGGVDEVRLTRAALTPSQFLAPLGRGTGMSIVFR